NVSHVASLRRASAQSVIFADNKKSAERAAGAAFGLCLATPEAASIVAGRSARRDVETSPGGAVAICESPRRGFALIAARLHAVRGLGPSASSIDAAASIHAGADIHPSAVVGADVEIADGVVVGAGAVIGPGVAIGEGGVIGAGVSIFCALIGARCAIKAGARIGEAGFGFVASPEGPLKAPQLGRVLIADDVEIGANSTVDRGALDDTEIGAGSKIDNLVQIAHNVVMGRGCIVAAQAGVAGSTRLGDGVIMGGGAGLADHLTIGDGVQIAGKSGVMHDIASGERWGGYPAQPARQWMREVAAARKRTTKKKD
ncbi:MAG: UDP-3-O-(3-hydroxymyristoyl)glucosamine N-acyltransferase, partial [Pseudomonadota bacterium]